MGTGQQARRAGWVGWGQVALCSHLPLPPCSLGLPCSLSRVPPCSLLPMDFSGPNAPGVQPLKRGREGEEERGREWPRLGAPEAWLIQPSLRVTELWI